MAKHCIVQALKTFLETDPSNWISEENARRPEYVGIRFFDEPLVGFAAADDEIIRSLEDNKTAGMGLKQPEEWLPGAKTVISFFLPFTEDIKKDNRGLGAPTALWQQGRVTGQMCVVAATNALVSMLRDAGHEAMAPIDNPHLNVLVERPGGEQALFISKWSERHVAYAAGLGTFGLSKGLITEKGTAGRFGSVITTLGLEPTPRPYKDLYEYCVMCGACARQCPGNAISIETGKDHTICEAYLRTVLSGDGSYYGCGKCQCGVPCESRIPGRDDRDI